MLGYDLGYDWLHGGCIMLFPIHTIHLVCYRSIIYLLLLPYYMDNNMVKQLIFATRIPGHVQPVGRPCGTWMHYAVRDVKDMGQQMGYRSLEWNWPKEAMNRPIWAGIVDGAKLF